MVCLARCPPTNPGDGENCYTLPDVTDNCCNVTVCDKPADSVPVRHISPHFVHFNKVPTVSPPPMVKM